MKNIIFLDPPYYLEDKSNRLYGKSGDLHKDFNHLALFNLINHAKFLQEIDFNLQDSIVIDLCCGTGAVGIEALSRGAKFAIFIDNNSQHLQITIKNIEKLNIKQELVVLNNNEFKL